MRVSKRLALAAGMLFLVGAGRALADPFLWLEERNGEKALAWVAEQNAKTTAELRGDPRYEPYVDTAFELFTASDNLAYGYVQGGFVYNFWQDDAHNLGIWRRTTPASYKTAAPQWETVIDFDALAAEEGTDWVFSNADCLAPAYQRCLVRMSPDGGDSVEIREFDLATKSFVKDGFFSPVSKSELSWFDADTLVLLPAYTADEQTTSGYPRSVKLWKHGTPREQAEADLRRRASRMAGRSAMSRRMVDFRDFVVGRATRLLPQGSCSCGCRTARCGTFRIPDDAILQQHFHGQLVFSLRSDWGLPDGTKLRRRRTLLLRLPAVAEDRRGRRHRDAARALRQRGDPVHRRARRKNCSSR